MPTASDFSCDVTPENPLKFAQFFPYVKNLISPDELIEGLITNLVKCCFSQMESVVYEKLT